MMSITFVVHHLRVHFYNLAADPASLRVPDYLIADLEFLSHRLPLWTSSARRSRRVQSGPTSLHASMAANSAVSCTGFDRKATAPAAPSTYNLTQVIDEVKKAHNNSPSD
jgi:hypothetical protein